MAAPLIRFRIDFGPESCVGPGKIDLLEAIRDSGSLSQAARDIGMSYRRAWLLLESINHSFRQPAAIASTGGRGGGGMTITPFGSKLLATYRQLESEFDSLARERLRAVAGEAVMRGVPGKTLRRRPLGRLRARQVRK